MEKYQRVLSLPCGKKIIFLPYQPRLRVLILPFTFLCFRLQVSPGQPPERPRPRPLLPILALPYPDPAGPPHPPPRRLLLEGRLLLLRAPQPQRRLPPHPRLRLLRPLRRPLRPLQGQALLRGGGLPQAEVGRQDAGGAAARAEGCRGPGLPHTCAGWWRPISRL